MSIIKSKDKPLSNETTLLPKSEHEVLPPIKLGSPV